MLDPSKNVFWHLKKKVPKNVQVIQGNCVDSDQTTQFALACMSWKIIFQGFYNNWHE